MSSMLKQGDWGKVRVLVLVLLLYLPFLLPHSFSTLYLFKPSYLAGLHPFPSRDRATTSVRLIAARDKNATSHFANPKPPSSITPTSHVHTHLFQNARLTKSNQCQRPSASHRSTEEGESHSLRAKAPRGHSRRLR